MKHLQRRWGYHLPVLLCLILIAILIWLPTGYEDALVYQESDIQPARVLSCDNSSSRSL